MTQQEWATLSLTQDLHLLKCICPLSYDRGKQGPHNGANETRVPYLWSATGL